MNHTFSLCWLLKPGSWRFVLCGSEFILAAGDFISYTFKERIVVMNFKSQCATMTHKSPTSTHADVHMCCVSLLQDMKSLPCTKNSHLRSKWKFHFVLSKVKWSKHVLAGSITEHFLLSVVVFLKCKASTCEDQSVQTPPGPSECGAGPPDQPAAFLRGDQRSPGQTVCAPAQCGIPQSKEILQWSVASAS